VRAATVVMVAQMVGLEEMAEVMAVVVRVAEMAEEKEDGFEGLAAWTCGGQKGWEWRKGKSIEKSLDARGGIGAEVLAKPKTN